MVLARTLSKALVHGSRLAAFTELPMEMKLIEGQWDTVMKSALPLLHNMEDAYPANAAVLRGGLTLSYFQDLMGWVVDFNDLYSGLVDVSEADPLPRDVAVVQARIDRSRGSLCSMDANGSVLRFKLAKAFWSFKKVKDVELEMPRPLLETLQNWRSRHVKTCADMF